jgi:hypothetical protein
MNACSCIGHFTTAGGDHALVDTTSIFDLGADVHRRQAFDAAEREVDLPPRSAEVCWDKTGLCYV